MIGDTKELRLVKVEIVEFSREKSLQYYLDKKQVK